MFSIPDLKRKFDEYLLLNQFEKEPRGLYEPINYILNLGGKRFRPVLVLAGCNLFSDTVDGALDAALSVEIFHNFTLVHDDIMDAAPLRRGKPTVHHKYDTNTAILSGDIMSIICFSLLNKLPNVDNRRLIELFSETSIAVCEGQQYDMDFETRDDVSIPNYIEMIEGKTAVLLGGALAMGAVIGQASSQDANHIYEYGKNLGISFQIQDDVLDAYGDNQKVGKQKAGDIIQGKKTYLYLKTKELLEGKDRNDFVRIYSDVTMDKEEKIASVMQYFRDVNVRGYAEELMEVYYQLAMSHLAGVTVNEERKAVLEDFSKDLFVREF